eukprot:9806375-Alexandrium_andersonii.AAC.1
MQRVLESAARDSQLRTALRMGACRCADGSRRWAICACRAVLALGVLVVTMLVIACLNGAGPERPIAGEAMTSAM